MPRVGLGSVPPVVPIKVEDLPLCAGSLVAQKKRRTTEITSQTDSLEGGSLLFKAHRDPQDDQQAENLRHWQFHP